MRKRTIYTVLFILAFAACSKNEIDQVIKVDAILENTDIQRVYLSYSSDFSGNVSTLNTDAEVFIEQIDGGNIVKRYDFYKKESGCWQAEFTPLPRETYTLHVNIPGKKSVSATTVYPDSLKIQPAYLNKLKSNTDEMSKSSSSASPDLDRYIWFYILDCIPELQTYKRDTAASVMWYYNYGQQYKPLWYIKDTLTSINGYSRLSGKERNHPAKFFNAHCSDLVACRNEVYLNIFESLSSSCRTYQYVNDITTNVSQSRTDTLYVMHPETRFVVESVNENYDRFIVDTLLDKNNRYSNIKNGTGIFGAKFTYSVTIKQIYGTAFDDWDKLDYSKYKVWK